MTQDEAVDPVDWSRRRWAEESQPEPDRFAAMAALMRTYQQMCAKLDEALKPHQLTRTGYLLMATLRMARSHGRPLGQLSRQMLVHPTTVTLLIDQLEERGLVQRTRHATDRRTVLAELTPAGADLVAKASADLADLGYGLGPMDDDATLALLDALRTVGSGGSGSAAGEDPPA